MKHRLPFDIIYEDRSLIVVDKPVGILTTHTHLAGRSARESQRTVENILCDYVRKGQSKSPLRAWLVHRLDRETSGILVFAKSEELAAHLRKHWNEIAHKTYLARVEGVLDAEHGAFESFLRDDPRTYRVSSVPDGMGGKFARTEWRRISASTKSTLVEVHLLTGRKNQIRVHFSEAGHPVVGDVKYGATPASRLMLHSWRLSLNDDANDIHLDLVAPPRQKELENIQ